MAKIIRRTLEDSSGKVVVELTRGWVRITRLTKELIAPPCIGVEPSIIEEIIRLRNEYFATS